MQRPVTRRSAARTTASGGSESPISSAAIRLAMRRAAATRKCPEPQAGSQTGGLSRAATRASAVPGAHRAEQRLVRQARPGEWLVQWERASVVLHGLEDAADAGQG